MLVSCLSLDESKTVKINRQPHFFSRNIMGPLTVSELQWCHAEMLLHVFPKERGIGKCEFFTNLLDTEISLPQVVTDILQHLFCNPFTSSLA